MTYMGKESKKIDFCVSTPVGCTNEINTILYSKVNQSYVYTYPLLLEFPSQLGHLLLSLSPRSLHVKHSPDSSVKPAAKWEVTL